MGVLVEQFEQIEDPYLRERKADVVQVGERVLKRLMGQPGIAAGRRGRGADDPRRARPVARRRDPVQAAPLRRVPHRPRRRDVAHGDRRAQPQRPGGGRDAQRAAADPRRRDADRRRQQRRRHRQSRPRGARRVPAEAERARARAAEAASACARKPRRDARRRARRALRQHRAARRPRAGARERRDRRRPLPLRVPVPQPRRACRPRTSSSRRIARSPRACRASRSRSARSISAPTSTRRASTASSRVAPNPALGLRAVRFCLAEPRLFLTQLRAILRASHYGKVRILVPMLASVGEIDQTLAMIAQAQGEPARAGRAVRRGVAVGGMIEIPAAVLAMGAFLRKLDFLSIGTNDLIQYTLAVDRADEAVSHLYDPLHPAVLRLLGARDRQREQGRRCRSPCAARWRARSQLTRLLLGLGLRNFSMHPAHLLERQAARAADRRRARSTALVDRIRRADEPRQARRAARASSTPDRTARARASACASGMSARRAVCDDAAVVAPADVRHALVVPRMLAVAVALRRRCAAVGVGDAAPPFALADRQRRHRSRSTSCAARSSTSTSGRRGAGRASARFRG